MTNDRAAFPGRKVYLRTAAALLLAAGMVCLAPGADAAEPPAPGKPVTNPFAGSAATVKAGEAIFDARCAECHGGDAMGMSGPDLTDDKWLYGGSDAEVFQTIAEGRKGGMPSWRGTLKESEIWQVIAYIRSLKK